MGQVSSAGEPRRSGVTARGAAAAPEPAEPALALLTSGGDAATGLCPLHDATGD